MRLGRARPPHAVLPVSATLRRKKYEPAWPASHHPARLWSRLDDGRVQCHLSPRNCKIGEGQAGFCRVRMNLGGELVSLNYGRAIQVTQESVETEAV